MPHWDTTPPDEPERFALRVVRTPPTGTLNAIVTAPGIVGTYTHFVTNRTVPCEGTEACEACADGYSKRWHGYLSAVLTKTYEHVLFEFTAVAAQPFRTYYDVNGSLRHCKFTASRPSGRPNGRIIIQCSRTDPRQVTIPEPIDVIRVLCHLWNIQYQPTPTLYDRDRRATQPTILKANGDGRYTPTTP